MKIFNPFFSRISQTRNQYQENYFNQSVLIAVFGVRGNQHSAKLRKLMFGSSLLTVFHHVILMMVDCK